MKPTAEIILDSISAQGHRITTAVLRFPRFILAEFNTHRVFSRNSASSRAIPTKRLLAGPLFVPEVFTANRPGMASNSPAPYQILSRLLWLFAAYVCLFVAWALGKLGVHKQHANRVLEPFLWHTVLVTSTDFEGFFRQRCHPAAQPEIRMAAEALRRALYDSIPVERTHHLPFADHLPPGPGARMISAGRCATVSFDNLGTGVAPTKDFARATKMAVEDPLHASPFEHVARAGDGTRNTKGWIQMREDLENGKVDGSW